MKQKMKLNCKRNQFASILVWKIILEFFFWTFQTQRKENIYTDYKLIQIIIILRCQFSLKKRSILNYCTLSTNLFSLFFCFFQSIEFHYFQFSICTFLPFLLINEKVILLKRFWTSATYDIFFCFVKS